MPKAILLFAALILAAAPAAPQTEAEPPTAPEAAPPPAPSYPDWLAGEFPYSALRLLDMYPGIGVALSIGKLLLKPLTFLALFLFVGGVFGRLAGRTITPRGMAEAAQYRQDERTARRLAISHLLAWAVALVVASEASGLHWVVALLTPLAKLVGTALIALVVLLLGSLIVSALGGEGREVLLSFLGSFYLQCHGNRPKKGQEFDLGDGVMGKIEKVGVLHTTFILPDGSREVRPNAWLMKTHFHWGEPGARSADAAPEEHPAGQ